MGRDFSITRAFGIAIMLIFFFMLGSAQAAAQEKGSIKLLAVTEDTEGNLAGSIATLYLEIRPGNGGVYLDTFPLTRVDTQISTRFAKEIACKEIDYDCSSYDFFYTIQADSTIVGGPSAGSAIAVLTVNMLKGWETAQDTAITGTINSGGLIGPVGGLRQKIESAAGDGVETILIPLGERFVDDENQNESIDLDIIAREKGVTLVEVSDLRHAVREFSGNELKQPEGEIQKNSEYTDTMRTVSEGICMRTSELREQLMESGLLAENETNQTLAAQENLTQQAETAIREGNYYSGASICFGINTRYGFLLLQEQNLSFNETFERISFEKKRIQLLNDQLEKKERQTISGLETYMIVKERLNEAEELLSDALKLLALNETRASVYNLAYAIERANSAESWSSFFGIQSKEYKINSEQIRQGCYSKIAEAEERYQYIRLSIPEALQDTQKGIQRAYKEANSGNYELCLYAASKAKAEADMVLGVFGVQESKIRDVIDRKLGAVKKNILLQQEKGFFPIMGYSYYEYASSLKERDQYSALLYAEYGLEMSNLDLYFPRPPKFSFRGITYDAGYFFSFLLGISAGMLVMMLLFRQYTGQIQMKAQLKLNEKSRHLVKGNTRKKVIPTKVRRAVKKARHGGKKR